MRKIKVLVIEPEKEPYEKEIDNTLESLQNEVYGDIEVFAMEDGVDAILNENGKIDNLPFNRYVGDDVFCGIFLIVGEKNGQSVSLNENQLQKYKEYFEYNKHRNIIESLKAQYQCSSETIRYHYTTGGAL